MQIIRGIYNLPHHLQQCVLTMGNFDGVHLGHQALIKRLVSEAKTRALPSVAMIFEPQPMEFFAPSAAPARLSALHEKYQQLAELGLDYLLCIPFNASVAKLTAEQFIEQWLIAILQAQYVLIGDDFHFGAKRQGDATLLAQYAKAQHFAFESLPTCMLQQQRISSTSVREALEQDNLLLAEQLLGHPYQIQGRVIHGNALARQLGFPTANIHLKRHKVALRGVYLVKVLNICTQQSYYGVANIGYRPTVDGQKVTLEVHLFDFVGDIYDHRLTVTFIAKIRDEKKFNSLDELTQQITQDVCIAKEIQAKF